MSNKVAAIYTDAMEADLEHESLVEALTIMGGPSSEANYPLLSATDEVPVELRNGLAEELRLVEHQIARVASGQAPQCGVERVVAELMRDLEMEDQEKALRVRERMMSSLEGSRTVSLDARSLRGAESVPSLPDVIRWAYRTETPDPRASRLAAEAVPQRGKGKKVPPKQQKKAPFKGLRLRLSSVTAVEDTDDWYKSDEVYCGVVGVDETGEVGQGPIFRVGDFYSGDTRFYPYPGKTLQYFDIREGGDVFPKYYTVVVSLMEHDFGSVSKWFSQLFDKIRERVVSFVGHYLGLALPSALGFLGRLIAGLFSLAIKWLFSKIKSWLEHDYIGTRSIRFKLNSYTGLMVDSGSRFSSTNTEELLGPGQGRYRVSWRWELVH